MKTINQVLGVATTTGLSLVVAGAVCLPLSARAADNSGSARPATIAKEREEIRAERQHMMAEARAEDAALTKMVAEMNKAPEAKKVDLEAAILTKLVAQHHQMLGEWHMLRAHMMHLRQERVPTSASNSSTGTCCTKGHGGKMTAQK